MKPQQLGRLLNIAPTTLRRWAREYGDFLSPSGRGNGGAYRTYSEQDARIMAWIATMRAQNISPQEIVLVLQATRNNNWRDLPPLPGGIAIDEPVAMMPREAAEERVGALEERFRLQLAVLERERDQLQARLEESEAEKSEMRRQMFAMNERILQLTERLAALLEKEHRRRK